MGFTKFSSLEFILGYTYITRNEIVDALGALQAMYESGNIRDDQYKNAVALLNDKLESL